MEGMKEAVVAQQFRKKPVVIEAMLWDGLNGAAIESWSDGVVQCGRLWAVVDTLEGDMRGNIGDWIIKGVQGEFYPCKPDIFEATYEAVPA